MWKERQLQLTLLTKPQFCRPILTRKIPPLPCFPILLTDDCRTLNFNLNPFYICIEDKIIKTDQWVLMSDMMFKPKANFMLQISPPFQEHYKSYRHVHLLMIDDATFRFSYWSRTNYHHFFLAFVRLFLRGPIHPFKWLIILNVAKSTYLGWKYK